MLTILQAFTPIISIFLVGIGWLYRAERAKRIFIEQQLSEKKYAFYSSMLGFFFNMMQGSRSNNKDTSKKMWEFNKNLYLYAPDDVLLKYKDWIYDNRNHDKKNSKRMIDGICEIIIAIRKDMGHKNTKVKNDDIKKHLLDDYDAAKINGVI